MSLSFSLDVTMRGLLSTTSRLNLVSQNITNAGKEGYTRKEGVDTYVTTNGGTVPVKTNIIGSTDRYLTKALTKDISSMGMNSAISEIMEYYATQLGATDGATTMSGFLNNLYGALQQLSVTPETLANKTEAVQVGTNLADSLRDLSSDIQNLRQQAEEKVTDTVASINEAISKLHKLNLSIVPGVTSDGQMAELEDQRMAALESLAKDIDIQYYFTAQNQVQIYTSSGQALLTSKPSKIEYEPATYITSTTTFNPLTLNGNDITGAVRGGVLAGNIELRDKILVEEQAKLDQFANVLKTQMNAILNKGASLPPQTTMTGTLRGLTAASSLAATGNLRVAVVDNSGTLQNYTDIDMTTISTVGDLVTALNGIANINASVNADGSLVISSTMAGTGVALDEMNSAVTPSNRGVSHYFGMQDFFTGDSAGTLSVTSFLRGNPNNLSTGKLKSGTLTAGDTVITRGDGSTSLKMAQILTSNVPFGAAGNFSAQNNTLSRYLEAVIADGATKASVADSKYETSSMIYGQTKATLNNKSGVNIDEETAKMLELQNAYQASARMIATIKTMFDALLQAVA